LDAAAKEWEQFVVYGHVCDPHCSVSDAGPDGGNGRLENEVFCFVSSEEVSRKSHAEFYMKLPRIWESRGQEGLTTDPGAPVNAGLDWSRVMITVGGTMRGQT
jgi:hypothetical protein